MDRRHIIQYLPITGSRKYSSAVTTYRPVIALFSIQSDFHSGTDTTVGEIMTEFGLQTWDEYCDFCNAARAAAVGRG